MGAAGLLLAACQGTISNPPPGVGAGAGHAGTTGSGSPGTGGGVVVATGTGGAGTPATCSPTAPDPGDAPLRLLSQEQYLNTVHDLFGAVNLDAVYPRSNSASTFGYAQGDVDQVALENYARAAGLVGAFVASNKTTLDKLAPCAAGADERTCAKTFIQSFGARLYRGPIAATELDRHLAMYDVGVPNGGYAHGIEMLLRGMLQSPRFLYKVELGTAEAVGPTAVKLSGYEVAARLSYGLWNTTPDDKLVAAAAAGRLATRDGVVTELQRMLQDPRGATMVPHFLESWIHLGDLYNVAKDTTRFPEWNDALKASMTEQARRFFAEIMTNQGASLTALLTSSSVYVDKTLAPFYGFDATPLAAGTFQKMDRAGVGSGLLTLSAFLATQSKAGEGSPIYRGRFVREQLLCQQLPSPPANVPPAPEIKPGVSTRERLSQHETDASCSACHRLMDPVGLGFENYDGIGRYRTMDSGKAVDASGAVSSTVDINGPFTGVPELAAKLTKSAEVQACVATQWFRYAMGRFEQSADACSVQGVVSAFRTAGGDLRTLPAALVQSDAFLYRRPLLPEVKP